MRKIYLPKIRLGGLWRARNQAGFIPMIIMILLVLGIILWIVYSRVSSSH